MWLNEGTSRAGRLLLADEALTPDSSRFWPADQSRAGSAQPSFDKQYVRDYVERLGWSKAPSAPALPDECPHAERSNVFARGIAGLRFAREIAQGS